MEYTATFEPDDFDEWALCGMDRDEKITDEIKRDLFDNCLYLCEAEQRTLTQTHDELRDAITAWADSWNDKANASCIRNICRLINGTTDGEA